MITNAEREQWAEVRRLRRLALAANAVAEVAGQAYMRADAEATAATARANAAAIAAEAADKRRVHESGCGGACANCKATSAIWNYLVESSGADDRVD